MKAREGRFEGSRPAGPTGPAGLGGSPCAQARLLDLHNRPDGFRLR